jgi:hypothetical protein
MRIDWFSRKTRCLSVRWGYPEPDLKIIGESDSSCKYDGCSMNVLSSHFMTVQCLE